MSKEKKFLVELTATQLLELIEWHESHVDRYRKMGIKKEYLKFHKETPLAKFIAEAYELIKNEHLTFDAYDRRISQLEIPSNR